MNGRRDELQSLCEAAVEGRLDADRTRRLEGWVLADPEARRFYVEYLHLHACLHWSAANPALPASPLPDDRPPAGGRRGSSGLRRAGWLATAAAIIAFATGAWLGTQPKGGGHAPTHVATLTGGKGCKWDGGSLPTEIGVRLPAGRLRLAEGLARFTFANGAEVTLEGPAELDLVSPRRCILHAGRLVAKVPPHAIGFIIDTSTAVIEDLGTEFGVSVSQGHSADVQVFDGRVDVRHRSSGRLEHMRTGEALRFAPRHVAQIDPLTDPPPTLEAGGGARLLQISTASGRGKDAYIRPPIPMRNGPDALLLVKNTLDDDYSRKAYLGLDLAPASGSRVVEARLSLTFAPSQLGFASEVPDATFAVYGLTDETLDGWDASTIRWDNAPANKPGGDGLDKEKVTLIGRFEIVQGLLTGIREISGAPIVDFLNRDTNGLVTLILIRETKGSGRQDLVHGFAGKHHPHLPPPTLKLAVVPR